MQEALIIEISDGKVRMFVRRISAGSIIVTEISMTDLEKYIKEEYLK